MKKIILSIITFIFCISITNASSININDIDTNTYIIGYQVFELNNYDISIYDVSKAIAEYTSINNVSESDLPIYFYSKDKNGYKKIEQIIGGINGKTKVPVKAFKNISDVFINNTLEVTTINGNKLNTSINIDSIINDLVKELNKQNGFSNVSFSNNTFKVTITDKVSAALNSSIVLSNIYKKYSNTINNNTISYTITLPDKVIIKENFDNKLNTLIKKLKDISKHLPNKTNNINVDLKMNNTSKNYKLVIVKDT